jgi:hypothetical protein
LKVEQRVVVESMVSNSEMVCLKEKKRPNETILVVTESESEDRLANFFLRTSFNK